MMHCTFLAPQRLQHIYMNAQQETIDKHPKVLALSVLCAWTQLCNSSHGLLSINGKGARCVYMLLLALCFSVRLGVRAHRAEGIGSWPEKHCRSPPLLLFLVQAHGAEEASGTVLLSS